MIIIEFISRSTLTDLIVVYSAGLSHASRKIYMNAQQQKGAYKVVKSKQGNAIPIVLHIGLFYIQHKDPQSCENLQHFCKQLSFLKYLYTLYKSSPA